MQTLREIFEAHERSQQVKYSTSELVVDVDFTPHTLGTNLSSNLSCHHLNISPAIISLEKISPESSLIDACLRPDIQLNRMTQCDERMRFLNQKGLIKYRLQGMI